ncbi:MAG: phosphoribosylaminoimidazolesuccinocarboxamide synthase [Planctomycetota bacterium]|nr:phosphoribosylaminoimidazolesuccinocarboxamide synthase [Planctomycetota bacterium]MCX8040267.1 phosphoribosylaminoimidazolesuccinocarboxamide synthase [Planctomycetota bacterium]MDW8372438.1 phosphoribosylaminoimidazolesuccinocarboxamide synthase [Planctomycetota bacterium]
MSEPLFESAIPGLRLLARGKVRDVWEIDERRLLFVATDRISAFDRVMQTPIPDKGRILTALTVFWLRQLSDVCPHHLLASDWEALPAAARAVGEALRGRCLVVQRLRMLPVESIVRGYLAGSAWQEYRRSGTVCGIPLPAGLRESERLPEPLWTPSTKAAAGHDENLPPAQARRLLGAHAALVERYSCELYRRAHAHALRCGIIIADTKFEFGVDERGEVVLADEVLTPDSSRFWPADAYQPGRAQESFDKQYLRDWLRGVGFAGDGPGIALPAEVVQRTREKYLLACRLLSGDDSGWSAGAPASPPAAARPAD